MNRSSNCDQDGYEVSTTRELLRATHVSKAFPVVTGELTVLQDVSVAIYSGEVVALLGRSGSGKSTLLRILAGLIRPSSGHVLSSGKELIGPNKGVAMVFQSFALLPWLTVLQNATLGLYARNQSLKVCESAALEVLRMVGLEGFEGAYPRELSGGMKQRVGFARAFLMKPEILMMDEPFSALDVLTAENLRGEISKLWQAGTFPARSILLVTHNIEEAVMLADRVIILGTNPGTIRGELTITLRRPRQAKNSEFRGLLDYIYKVMTDPTATVEDVSSLTKRRFPTLPHVRAGGVSGLLEIIADQGGEADLPALAEQLRLEVDDLLPVVDAAVMLGFASTSEGDVRITDTGRAFVAADIDRSWWIFRIQILERVPLVRTILHILQQKRDGGVKREFFTDILAEHFSESEAEAQLDTLITWGRYAQLFDYDADEQRLFLSTPSEDWETASPAAAQQRELEQHEKTDTGKI
jgi:NitT/TauT family transport system ATP-binding protein